MSIWNQGKNEKRIALVIGNSDYGGKEYLPSPKNDARDIAVKLNDLGFDIVLVTDKHLEGMKAALAEFKKKLAQAGKNVNERVVACLFYSGHGLQVDGKNYLVPVDIEKLQSKDDLNDLLALDEVLREMTKNAKTRLVFLDACRNNPFQEQVAKTMSGSKGIDAKGGVAGSTAPQVGLAEIDAGADTFIAYAAEPGKSAWDPGGPDDNSYFTEGLLRHIDTNGVEVNEFMNRTRNHVIAKSPKRQIPWNHSALTEKFFFKPISLKPLLTMGFLGVLTGLLCVVLEPLYSALYFQSLVFHEYMYGPVGEFLTYFLPFDTEWLGNVSEWEPDNLPGRFVGAILYGSVIAYGLLKWGRGTLMKSIIAISVVVITLFYAEPIFTFVAAISNVASNTDTVSNIEATNSAFALFAGSLIAGAFGAIGTLLGGALTTPALRTPNVWFVTTFIGSISTIPYFLSSWVAEFMQIWALLPVWQGAVAATIGYFLATHVPTESEIRRVTKS